MEESASSVRIILLGAALSVTCMQLSCPASLMTFSNMRIYSRNDAAFIVSGTATPSRFRIVGAS